MTDGTRERLVRPQETFSVISNLTGEVIASEVDRVCVARGSGNKTEEEHHRVFTKELRQLCSLDLQGAELKVLLSCMAYCDYDNLVRCSPAQIKSDWGLHSSTISLAFSRLREKGLLYYREAPGQTRDLVLDCSLAFKGSNKRRRKEIQRRSKQDSADAADSLLEYNVAHIVPKVVN